LRNLVGPRAVLPRGLLLGGLLLGGLLLGGCTGGQLSLSGLRAVPGARAAYPGAVTYQRLETEASANVMAKNPALIKVDACADAAPEQVLAWFAGHLRGAGWTRDAGRTTLSDTGEFQPAAVTWSRGARHFELRFLTAAYADRLAERAGEPGGCRGAYETVVS
jgi:hypothetical protein